MSPGQFYKSIVPALRMKYSVLIMISSTGEKDGFYQQLLLRRDDTTGVSPFMVRIAYTTCELCIAMMTENTCTHTYALYQPHWLSKGSESVMRVFYGEELKAIYQAEIANLPPEGNKPAFLPQQILALRYPEDGGTLQRITMVPSLHVDEVVLAVDPALGGTDHMGLCAVYMWGEQLVVACLDSNQLSTDNYENDETALLMSNIRALRSMPHLRNSLIYFVCERTGNAEVYHLIARLREREAELGPIDYHHSQSGKGKGGKSRGKITPGFWTDNQAKIRMHACARGWLSCGRLRADTHAVCANPWLAREEAMLNKERTQRAFRRLAVQYERARFIVNMKKDGSESISVSAKLDARGIRRLDFTDDLMMASWMAMFVCSARTQGRMADARGV